MKNLFAIVICVVASNLLAQQVDTTLTLSDFEMPSSPGFILLDQAPSSIERPNSPKAFAISVLNSFSESNGLPKNYAVEFTPFWFFRHPNMNVLRYAGYRGLRQRPFSSVKMLSLSVAYINQTDSLSTGTLNNISIGARTNLIKIRSAGNLRAIADANTTAVGRLRSINDTIVARIGPGDPSNPEGYRRRQNELLIHLQDSLKNNISNALLEKPVFAVDFAIAYNTFLQTMNFQHNNLVVLGLGLQSIILKS